MIPRRLIEDARRLLARETGAVRKPHHGRLRIALAFPNVYRVGMSSLGFQLVYGALNAIPDVVCERVFLPDPQRIADLQRSGTPLFTLESQTAVRDFDVLGFSVAFELDYIHVPRILGLSGLPPLAAERDESHPLVIAGGPAVTFNPEPLADFTDAFLIGEAEDALPEIVDAIRSGADRSRDQLLRGLAGVKGVYVPRFYTPRYRGDGLIERVDVAAGVPQKVSRRVTEDLDSHNASSLIITPDTEFADMTLTEAIRGCGRKCRFCAAGYINLPPRPRRVAVPDGARRIGLVGSAVFDHPDARSICEALVERGRLFSVSAIRLESLTRELAGLMRQGGQETITLAPEAGTQRLRNIINKPTTDDEIFRAVTAAYTAGFRRMKLYFMVGLPTETEEDAAGIIDLVARIADRYPSLSLQLSVSCYVPKPWTPFQWLPMAPERDLSARLALLRRMVARMRRVSLSAESPRMSVVQAWLARGDRRVSAVLLQTVEHGSYARSIAEAGLDPSFYAHRQRGREDTLPWDHIDLGVRKDFLWREYQKSLEEKPTSPCDTPTCKQCGVC